jgi:hypothetical protein
MADALTHPEAANDQTLHQLTSLATLAERLDADRTALRRLLRAAGVRPVILGHGKNATIRYVQRDVDEWLKTRLAAR